MVRNKSQEWKVCLTDRRNGNRQQCALHTVQHLPQCETANDLRQIQWRKPRPLGQPIEQPCPASADRDEG